MNEAVGEGESLLQRATRRSSHKKARKCTILRKRREQCGLRLATGHWRERRAEPPGNFWNLFGVVFEKKTGGSE
jgi:hypothetical protein